MSLSARVVPRGPSPGAARPRDDMDEHGSGCGAKDGRGPQAAGKENDEEMEADVSPVCPGRVFGFIPTAEFDVVFESDVAFVVLEQIRESAACGAGLVLPRLFGLCRDISATEGEGIALSGGDAWESNPPGALLRPHTGFEDQAAHRNRRTSVVDYGGDRRWMSNGETTTWVCGR